MNPMALAFLVLIGNHALAFDSKDAEDIPLSEEMIDQPSRDITVVSAVTSRKRITTSGISAIDRSNCDNGRHYGSICTRFLEKLLGMPFKEEVTLSTGFYCRPTRIVTVTRKAALKTADGIGFVSRGGGEGRYLLKKDLSEVGSAVLKNGEEGVLHQFAGLNDCRTTSGKVLAQGNYTFRPYLKFITSRGIYNNWDSIESDYLLNAKITRFDRSREVLR